MAIDIQVTIGGAPIYRQVIDQIRLGIASGRLPDGEQLPSVRALAEKLLVNPNTIARAYSELVRDGVLESRHGQGVFIAPRREVYSAGERERRLMAAVDSLVSEAVALQCSALEIRTAVESRLKELGLDGRRRNGGRTT